MSYIPTTDPDIVKEVSTSEVEINLANLIQEYLEIKSGLLSLAKPKTTPDQETLNYWNSVAVGEAQIEKETWDLQAFKLYSKVKPIYDAGLLPSDYHDEYLQLENYLSNL